jgi:hypothetical protein
MMQVRATLDDEPTAIGVAPAARTKNLGGMRGAETV